MRGIFSGLSWTVVATREGATGRGMGKDDDLSLDALLSPPMSPSDVDAVGLTPEQEQQIKRVCEHSPAGRSRRVQASQKRAES